MAVLLHICWISEQMFANKFDILTLMLIVLYVSVVYRLFPRFTSQKSASVLAFIRLTLLLPILSHLPHISRCQSLLIK